MIYLCLLHKHHTIYVLLCTMKSLKSKYVIYVLFSFCSIQIFSLSASLPSFKHNQNLSRWWLLLWRYLNNSFFIPIDSGLLKPIFFWWPSFASFWIRFVTNPFLLEVRDTNTESTISIEYVSQNVPGILLPFVFIVQKPTNESSVQHKYTWMKQNQSFNEKGASILGESRRERWLQSDFVDTN